MQGNCHTYNAIPGSTISDAMISTDAIVAASIGVDSDICEGSMIAWENRAIDDAGQLVIATIRAPRRPAYRAVLVT